MMPRKSSILRLLLVTILASMLFALPVSATSDAPTNVEFQAVADNGTLATCSLKVYDPYVSYEPGFKAVYASSRVTCTAVVSYITVVAEVKGPNGSNSYPYTCYNAIRCNAYAYRVHTPGYWSSWGSAQTSVGNLGPKPSPNSPLWIP